LIRKPSAVSVDAKTMSRVWMAHGCSRVNSWAMNGGYALLVLMMPLSTEGFIFARVVAITARIASVSMKAHTSILSSTRYTVRHHWPAPRAVLMKSSR